MVCRHCCYLSLIGQPNNGFHSPIVLLPSRSIYLPFLLLCVSLALLLMTCISSLFPSQTLPRFRRARTWPPAANCQSHDSGCCN